LTVAFAAVVFPVSAYASPGGNELSLSEQADAVAVTTLAAGVAEAPAATVAVPAAIPAPTDAMATAETVVPPEYHSDGTAISSQSSGVTDPPPPPAKTVVEIAGTESAPTTPDADVREAPREAIAAAAAAEPPRPPSESFPVLGRPPAKTEPGATPIARADGTRWYRDKNLRYQIRFTIAEQSAPIAGVFRRAARSFTGKKLRRNRRMPLRELVRQAVPDPGADLSEAAVTSCLQEPQQLCADTDRREAVPDGVQRRLQAAVAEVVAKALAEDRRSFALANEPIKHRTSDCDRSRLGECPGRATGKSHSQSAPNEANRSAVDASGATSSGGRGRGGDSTASGRGGGSVSSGRASAAKALKTTKVAGDIAAAAGGAIARRVGDVRRRAGAARARISRAQREYAEGDTRLLLQLGIVFSLLYLAFVSGWIWVTRLRHTRRF